VLRWLLRSEAGVARALGRALLRRGPAGGDGTAVPYAGRTGVAIGGMCAIGVLETGVVHLLVPWPALRWALLGLSVYALLWLAGLWASLHQHPHLLRDGELVLRFGHWRTLHVPLDGLVAVRRVVDAAHRRTVAVEGDRLAVAVLGETDVELRFDPPVRVDGQDSAVTRVAFSADDPAAAVRALRSRVVSGPA
jgi:hypothetical protein